MARILLIDDEEPVCTTLRLTLEHFGYTVIEARNGTEGLELFQRASGAGYLQTAKLMGAAKCSPNRFLPTC